MSARIRSDQRKLPSEMRPFYCSSALLSRSDGSVRFKSGDSSVLCSVFGPMEVKIRDEKLDKATVEVVFKAAAGNSTTKERLYERVIRETLEASILTALHPRSAIRITLQVLTDDGGILSTALNAATLALVDAGIALRSLPAGVTCMIDQEGVLLLDPTILELEAARSTHMFVFDNISDGALSNISTGSFSMDEYTSCYDTCFSAVAAVQQLFRSSVEGKVRREHGPEADA
ncbi:Exosome component 5 [Geranomyces variabilis]|uniref:Exosome component 5 n=1 Tax=Geranomyces variabilis TaxID=109894 RepID=A0AAD5XRF3_9FUNG|nr:Exosome component 5 [Geranomyces variabilis]